MTMSKYILPCLILLILISGMIRKTDSYACFLEGAKEGLISAAQIAPALIGLLAAIGMMRASGLMDFIVACLSPVTSFLKIPKEILPLMLMRPVSGSGALAIVSDLLHTYGPDSDIGLLAAVMMGSTETTFYAISVYFAAAGIRKVRYTVAAALAADAVGMLVSILVCRL